LLYVFAIGLLGNLGSSGGAQTKEQLIMEAYNWSPGGAGSKITLTVRNVGSAAIDATSTDVFVNGISAGTLGDAGCAITLTPLGGSCTASITAPTGTYTPGAAYPLKLVTPDGGVFSYSVIDGGSS
jgi:archaellum component FlaF (FlaF/FlaG flagellin family)